MKKLALSLVAGSLVGLSSTLVMAQTATSQISNAPGQTQPAPHVVDPAVQAQRLAKRLNLSSDQQAQVLSILAARRDQAAGLRNDSTLSHAERHAKMTALRSDSEAKVRALLTDDQKQTFDQMQQRRLQRQQERKS